MDVLVLVCFISGQYAFIKSKIAATVAFIAARVAHVQNSCLSVCVCVCVCFIYMAHKSLKSNCRSTAVVTREAAEHGSKLYPSGVREQA